MSFLNTEITQEEKDLFILHRQYQGCWWPGDTKSQGISSPGIDLISAA